VTPHYNTKRQCPKNAIAKQIISYGETIKEIHMSKLGPTFSTASRTVESLLDTIRVLRLILRTTRVACASRAAPTVRGALTKDTAFGKHGVS